MLRDSINIDQLVEEALALNDERARRVLIGRYGIGKRNRKTLAALGKEYQLTRERIRQIESNSIKTIRGKIKEHKEAVRLLKLLEGYLKDVGDIRRGDFVAKDLAILLGRDDHEEEFYNKLNFIVDILGWPYVSNDNESWHRAWYSKPEMYKNAKDLAEHLLGMDDHDFEKFLKTARAKFKLSEPQIINHLTISKRFGIGPYGDLGADHWVHVNPKTVRDKVYLVLQKCEEPLHFRDIADQVNALSDRKRAAATVHNELIKDPRFVLVSRGTYAIGE